MQSIQYPFYSTAILYTCKGLNQLNFKSKLGVEFLTKPANLIQDLTHYSRFGLAISSFPSHPFDKWIASY